MELYTENQEVDKCTCRGVWRKILRAKYRSTSELNSFRLKVRYRFSFLWDGIHELHMTCMKSGADCLCNDQYKLDEASFVYNWLF